MVLAERKLQIAALGDLAGVLDRLGIVGKQRRHLLGRTKVEALRLIAHAVFVVHGLARLDAEQNIVRVGIFFSKIVRVVRHDEREPRLLVQAQDALVDDGLIADAVVLQFEVKVLGGKDFRQCQGIFLGTVVVAIAEPSRDLTGETRRERDEALGVLAQKIQVDARLDVKALDVRH